MAVTAPVLGGVTLPQVSEYREKEGMRGGSILLVNGGIKFDTVTTRKRTFSLIWRGISTDQKIVVSNAFMAVKDITTTAFIPPWDTTATAPNNTPTGTFVTWSDEGYELQWQPTAVAGGNRLIWETTMLLREV